MCSFVSTFCGMGKMLLRKVVLANISVFNIVALPEKVKYLWDSLLL